jgi:signal peptidase I
MISFFKHRKLRKEAKHRLHESRHFRRMKEDIAPPELIASAKAREVELARALRRRDYAALADAIEAVTDTTEELIAGQKYSFMREHLEVAVVALSVAMAVRAYFFQPFKIPTGSMQPTLYGITVESQTAPTIIDRFPLNYIIGLYTGEFYREVRAKSSGEIRHIANDKINDYYEIGGIRHKVSEHMKMRYKEGAFVNKDDVIASGRFIYGDHIFVDRISYNFRMPRRGDIFVFRTDHIHHPQITPKTYYIKRLVGLPGETVEIDRAGRLIVDGQVWDADYAKNWTPEERALKIPNGEPLYIDGHILAHPGSLLSRPGEKIVLGDDEYLPMGDNTRSSLDGRYFGGVEREDIVGPAFMVYWPFNRRWGLVD